ncbi:MAG: fumarate hydratase [Spirochaetales bacterium]|nr:fumarate hydratase [Spirochaetales bacterium]
MRKIDGELLYKKLYDSILESGVILPKDVSSEIIKQRDIGKGLSKTVLSKIVENLECAKNSCTPMCQDTGMVLLFVEIGRKISLENIDLDKLINKAVEDAYRDGYFRKSVVSDPLNGRENSKNNLPAVIYYDFIEGDKLKISGVLKGFGSENCSKVFMLKPTEGREKVIDVVLETIKSAGGSPCPPTVLGIGIGGTMDYAAKLSKKALLRELNDENPNPYYKELEDEILEKVNSLNIGPGGLGGGVTSLGVKIEHYPTHIAGLPVAISVNCWADRKVKVEI